MSKKKARLPKDGTRTAAFESLEIELKTACKIIRDDCSRALGIIEKLDWTDADGKLMQRLDAIGGRLKFFMRAGKRYVAALSSVQQLAATM